MKQYILTSQANGAKKLALQEVTIPVPKSDEVLVKVAAVSLNFRDYYIVQGLYPEPLPTDIVPVSDGAGEVVAIGEDVTDFTVGQRVATHFLPNWRSGEPEYDNLSLKMGGPLPGMLTEYALVSQEALIAVPDYLSYSEAATLPVAALTAWNAVVVEGQVNAAHTVVIQGTGGVALFAAQFAKMHGAKVILLSGSDAKLMQLVELRADITINYKTTSDWPEKVLKHTGGRGADVVIDVAGMTINKSLRALRPGGTVCAIGLLSGHSPEVNLLPLFQYKKKIAGITIGSYAMYQDMLRAMERHQLHPYIGTTFTFSEAPEAFIYLAEGKHIGKVVVDLQ